MSLLAQKGVKWLTVEQAETLMQQAPKKVLVDVYTDWCGWCKVMDKKTYTHPKVIKYINENFYAIKLNAEQAKEIRFNNKVYKTIPGSKTNELAAEWMNNKLSYPTTILMDEQFGNPQPIPGYLEVKTMEMILTYFAQNKHKTTPWDTYSKEFKSTW
jgi:Highly conserved protein containing a thioredoxin domain